MLPQEQRMSTYRKTGFRDHHRAVKADPLGLNLPSSLPTSQTDGYSAYT